MAKMDRYYENDKNLGLREVSVEQLGITSIALSARSLPTLAVSWMVPYLTPFSYGHSFSDLYSDLCILTCTLRPASQSFVSTDQAVRIVPSCR